MRMPTKICSIAIVCVLCFQVNAYCSPWDDFLKKPKVDGLVMLKKSIGKNAEECDFGNPINQSIAPDDKQINKLFGFICHGNESAFRAALMVSKCFGTGDSEDFYRSSGLFFERKPLTFLKIIKEKKIQDSELEDFLTMLPLYSVDKVDLKISMIKNRIKILGNIHDQRFNMLKTNGMRYLRKEKEFLESKQIEEDSK